MDSIDALGPRPDRLAAFTGDMLSTKEDQELNAIVQKAAKDLGTPIALVNLVLEHIQFFKAHHGLPEELIASRGTHRDVSFCQFVVRLGEPFEVTDAENDDRIPQHLVRHYGIRSYLGMPIVANDNIVGSLCVIDTKPRGFSSQDRQQLQKLAALVNIRLSHLAANRKKTASQTRDQNLITGIEKLSQSLAPIAGDIQHGRSNTIAIKAFLTLMDFSLNSQTVHPEVVQQTLDAAIEALNDSLGRFSNIEIDVEQARTAADNLLTIIAPNTPSNLKMIVDKVLHLHAPLLDRVGGCTLEEVSSSLYIASSKAFALSIVSTCLSTLAGFMLQGHKTNGIHLQLISEKGRPGVILHPLGLRSKEVRALEQQLVNYLDAKDFVSLHIKKTRLLLLFNRVLVG